MFKNLSLRTRLLLPPAAVFALLLLMAGLAVHAQRNASTQLESQRQAWKQSVESALNLRILVDSKVSALYQSLTWEAVGFEAAQVKKLDADLKRDVGQLSARVQELMRRDGLGADEQALLESMLKPLKAFAQAVKDTLEMKSSSQGLGLAAMTLSGAEAAARDLDKALQQLEALSRSRVETAAKVAAEDLARATGITVVLVAAALLSGGLLVLVGYRSVRAPVAELERALQTLAAGDLSTPIQTQQRDEIGALIRRAEDLRQGLRNLLGKVSEASGTVGRAASEIAAGTQDLSARTEQQASALQQTAASMEQIHSTVQNNSNTAQQASDLATEAARVAELGRGTVGEVVTTMSEISQQSRRIADITGMIDGIAFQTNILALNAAVEAARAGEQGRGFAVVAAEVRTLAQRSATAAREIKTLISESAKNVERGTELAGSAGKTISGMVQEFARLHTTIQAISVATREQSSGVGQVTASVSEVDRLTQHNAALVEQSAAAAQMLTREVEQLNDALRAFRLEPQAH
jgi:methyl-accepting chemotaxis protein